MKKALAVLFLAAILTVAAVGSAAAKDGGNGASAAPSSSRSDDGGRGHDGRNQAEHAKGESEAEDGEREAGEDVRGNCDEAEHRGDAACATAASSSVQKDASSAARTTATSGSVRSSAASGRQLIAKVGPGYTISLRTTAGAIPRNLRPGAYTIVVRDLSEEHNFHLRGAGVDKTTSVSGTGTTTLRVTLARGTYRFVCEPHASMMNGSIKVS